MEPLQAESLVLAPGGDEWREPVAAGLALEVGIPRLSAEEGKHRVRPVQARRGPQYRRGKAVRRQQHGDPSSHAVADDARPVRVDAGLPTRVVERRPGVSQHVRQVVAGEGFAALPAAGKVRPDRGDAAPGERFGQVPEPACLVARAAVTVSHDDNGIGTGGIRSRADEGGRNVHPA